jgi:hypothetical protein
MAAEVERVCGSGLPPGHTHQDHLANGTNGITVASTT